MRQFVKKGLIGGAIFVFVIINISWTFKPVDYTQLNNNSPLFFHPYFGTNSSNDNNNSFHFVYDSLSLYNKGLSDEAFMYAMEGFEELLNEGVVKNDSIITIIDFDQPSYNKRLYVIDVKNYKILFNTWAAHGKNSGREWAQSFSNHSESNKSSLGFYVTEGTYNGNNGFSLKLMGLEKSLNDNAYERAIVLHGADYVSESYINSQGFIGRSHGCPAVSEKFNRPIIEKIKNGSCLFIYNKAYKSLGKLIQS